MATDTACNTQRFGCAAAVGLGVEADPHELVQGLGVDKQRSLLDSFCGVEVLFARLLWGVDSECCFVRVGDVHFG